MIGASRKSFIGAILDAPVEEREEGTISVTVLAAMKGAKIIRVHDVGKNRHAIKITQAILRQRRE
jgi:dihydropteroate synthase